MIRALWVWAVGGLSTLFWASRVMLAVWTRSPKLLELGHTVPRAWSRSILWAAGVRVESSGLERLAGAEPRVLVANHESWFDVFALCSVLPSPFRFVGKKELARIPLFGPAWVGSGHLAIDRSDRNAAIQTLEDAAQRMTRHGFTIVMFPEGTRSADGALQRFKKGSFVLALQAHCPVAPVGIAGSRDVLPKNRFRIRKGTIRIHAGDLIPTEDLTMEDRERLLHASREAVARLRDEARGALPAAPSSVV